MLVIKSMGHANTRGQMISLHLDNFIPMQAETLSGEAGDDL